MYDWETRLTSVDSNRVVRPLEWGIEWTRDWPCRNGFSPARTDAECERYLCEYNRRAIASSDEFFGYRGWKNEEFRTWQEFTNEIKIKYKHICFSQPQAGVLLG